MLRTMLRHEPHRFAFGFVYVQLEIHDTVKEPSRPRMRSAVRIACTVALGLCEWLEGLQLWGAARCC